MTRYFKQGEAIWKFSDSGAFCRLTSERFWRESVCGIEDMDDREEISADEGELKSPIPTGIEASVCQDIAARQLVGVAKYGTTVADNPLSLREWLQHAYEECLDQAVYLKRAMAELDNPNKPKL